MKNPIFKVKNIGNQLILAIDFDNTVAVTEFPNIHSLYEDAKRVINKYYDMGVYIIIWTCRTGKSMLEAELFLLDCGVKFHKINRQHPKVIHDFCSDTELALDLDGKKVFSHLLIDDTSIDWAINGHPGWSKLDTQIQQYIDKEPNKWKLNKIIND